MMRQMKLIYALMLAMALPLMTACSSDDAANGGETPTQKDGKIKVHLRVSAAGSETMRAWQDNEHATDAEMMNVWTVVAVHDEGTNANKVAAIYACKPTGDPSREVDDVILPEAGKYRFYSFANMSPKVVMSLLSIGGDGAATNHAAVAGESYPDGDGNQAGTTSSAAGPVTPYYVASDTQGDSDNDNIGGYTFTDDTYYDIAFTEGSTVTAESVNNKTVNVPGNNFDITADNGYGAIGIPMSNVQTITVTDGANVDLIVIRLMAKIELRFYNETGADLTVNSITLTDINGNADDNLKLLPILNSATGHDVMNVVNHGDIQPNLGTGKSQKDLKLNVNTTVGSEKTLANGKYQSVAFYVNESEKPALTANNQFRRFFLKVDINGQTEQRYALIDDDNNSASGGDGTTGKWDYIARNDYRIIPIVLDDYKLDMIPYDFPAIGVYPASVKEEDGLYTINFHDYGHFHLLPVVKKLSDSSVVPFATTAPTGPYSSTSWGLINDDFANSWGSWTDATKATEYVNESADPAFYRKGYASWVPVDGDEVGGEPKWYKNDGTAGPQWDPAASGTYRPFILGYVADPEGTVTTDRKVYHEFSIYLYKKGMSAPRQMTYRLYMILDTDQMMYSRMFGAPRVRHTHGY